MAKLLLDYGAKQGRGTETTPFRTVTRDPDIEKLLGEYASGERVPFRKNSSEIQRILQELEKMPHILKELANIFGGKSLSEVLEEENSSIIQPCLLAALTVFLPNLRSQPERRNTRTYQHSTGRDTGRGELLFGGFDQVWCCHGRAQGDVVPSWQHRNRENLVDRNIQGVLQQA